MPKMLNDWKTNLILTLVAFTAGIAVSILEYSKKILRNQRRMLHIIESGAVRASLVLYSEGVPMSVSVVVGQPVSAVFKEFNLAGSEVPVVNPLEFSSSDASIATVDVNGIVTILAPGSVTISGRDSVNGLNGSDSALVTAGGGGDNSPVSATLTLEVTGPPPSLATPPTP